MSAYSKSTQAGRPRPSAKRHASNSTLAAPTSEMAKMSPKRQRIFVEQYLPARKRFLAAHPHCEMNIIGICTRGQHEATTIQHMIQRSLDPSIRNLLDESHWLPACWASNAWAGQHPQEAILLGVEIDPKGGRE